MSLSFLIAKQIVNEKATVEQVIFLLKKYKMLALLPSIKHSVVKLYNEQNKKESIIIETPFELSDSAVTTIKRIVGNDTAHHEVVLNKHILAGFKARFKGVLYDGSAERIIKQLLKSN